MYCGSVVEGIGILYFTIKTQVENRTNIQTKMVWVPIQMILVGLESTPMETMTWTQRFRPLSYNIVIDYKYYKYTILL